MDYDSSMNRNLQTLPIDQAKYAINGNAVHFETHTVHQEEFVLLSRYQKLKRIGIGAQGTVASGTDSKRNNQRVAIKKLTKAFLKEHDAKRAYREIFLLKRLNHPNIISLLNLFSPESSLQTFNNIYIVMDCLEANLNHLKSIKLDHPRIKFIVYQMLCALNYLHKNGVAHRDLKPSNIVINPDCSIKILDFGLARSIIDLDNTSINNINTQYVVTRYYRAPEVILGIPYGVEVDVWSVGCIMAELILKKALMPGENFVDQWDKVCDVVGTPPPQFFDSVPAPDVRTYCLSKQRKKPQNLEELLPSDIFPTDKRDVDFYKNCEYARSLIENLLIIDHKKRMSVDQALQHRYLEYFFDPSSLTPEIRGPFPEAGFELPDGSGISPWKKMIWDEVNIFEERAPDDQI